MILFFGIDIHLELLGMIQLALTVIRIIVALVKDVVVVVVIVVVVVVSSPVRIVIVYHSNQPYSFIIL